MDDSASSLSEISRKETLFGPVFETDLMLSLDWPYTVGTQHAEQTICWCAPNRGRYHMLSFGCASE
jgi:hypothetical protein